MRKADFYFFIGLFCLSFLLLRGDQQSSPKELTHLANETLDLDTFSWQEWVLEQDPPLARIGGLAVDGENLFINDTKNFQVFRYLKGHFKNAIGRRGEGPGEYVQVMAMKPCDRKLFIMSSACSVHIFNYDGSFVRSSPALKNAAGGMGPQFTDFEPLGDLLLAVSPCLAQAVWQVDLGGTVIGKSVDQIELRPKKGNQIVNTKKIFLDLSHNLGFIFDTFNGQYVGFVPLSGRLVLKGSLGDEQVEKESKSFSDSVAKEKSVNYVSTYSLSLLEPVYNPDTGELVIWTPVPKEIKEAKYFYLISLRERTLKKVFFKGERARQVTLFRQQGLWLAVDADESRIWALEPR